MRVIGLLSSEVQAQKLSEFLFSNGIENRFEALIDPTTNQTSYQIWVSNEDDLEKANDYYQRFISNPNDSFFSIPIQIQIDEPVVQEKIVKRPSYYFATNFFLALCVFVYLLNLIQEISINENHLPAQAFMMTPIQKELLFDLPPIVPAYEAFLEKYQIQPKLTIDDLPPLERQELETVLKAPFWRGIYDWILIKMKTGDETAAEGGMFTKIREGDLWRLFSPCVLHRDLLHILFNMIWLWVLGKPIEQRIGAWRTLLLILPIGIVSNVFQYLMSGFLFLGFSGVVTGLAGFIWMRERISPWEGYPLQRSTILFLVFFVLSMFVLQALSFLVQLLTNLSFILSIANTAHIAGAIVGALLGRLSFFAWRLK